MSDPVIRPVIFHVDLDAFYASVEQRDDPSLRGRPVIVGAAPGRRGVVSACSYEARRFGIHSAMPISQAWRRCPQGVYLPVRMERYLEVSHEVMEILASYTPHMQQISVDEAFLDMTGTERLFGPPSATGTRLKTDVRSRTASPSPWESGRTSTSQRWPPTRESPTASWRCAPRRLSRSSMAWP